MGVVYLNDSTLTDIASAIRYQEGSSTTYYPSEMGNAIRNLNITPSEVDVALIPELKIDATTNYFELSTTLPEGATLGDRCDILDERISKPAYYYRYSTGSGTSMANYVGIYSPVNNVNDIGIISMSNAFSNLTGFKSSPICTWITANMADAYNNSSFITGSPICSPRVTDFSYAYNNCQNLTGNPVCGERVVDMNYTYFNCRNLTGEPVFGENVIYCNQTYVYCVNLTGNAVFPAKKTELTSSIFGSIYSQCSNLSGITISDEVTNMNRFAYGCAWYTGTPSCGENVTDMGAAYWGCTRMTGSPVMGDNVIYATNAYVNCSGLTGNAIFPKTTTQFNNLLNAVYFNCIHLEGINIPTDNEISLEYFASNCRWYKGSPVCTENTTSLNRAYNYCVNMVGSPVCGSKVTDLSYAYYECQNITGSPVCGNNVNSMAYAYTNCTKLTGSPVCGDAVTTMPYAYYLCNNITGSPVCGNNVVFMASAYRNCSKLSGNPANTYATNLYQTYMNCPNLYGDMYLFNTSSTASSTVTMYQCFQGRNARNRLNIHVADGYALNNWLYNVGTLTSTSRLAWTTMDGGYYNATANIYVYYDL